MASIRCERERERELELEQQQQQEQQQQEPEEVIQADVLELHNQTTIRT
jgi:hypothetical protein